MTALLAAGMAISIIFAWWIGYTIGSNIAKSEAADELEALEAELNPQPAPLTFGQEGAILGIETARHMLLCNWQGSSDEDLDRILEALQGAKNCLSHGRSP
jgi:hypothetical protein